MCIREIQERRVRREKSEREEGEMRRLGRWESCWRQNRWWCGGEEGREGAGSQVLRRRRRMVNHYVSGDRTTVTTITLAVFYNIATYCYTRRTVLWNTLTHCYTSRTVQCNIVTYWYTCRTIPYPSGLPSLLLTVTSGYLIYRIFQTPCLCS